MWLMEETLHFENDLKRMNALEEIKIINIKVIISHQMLNIIQNNNLFQKVL